ncbi:KGK domain-containing protein [Limnoraphis robusta Tam1]|uniref:KGK domain-containing protein n=1 Tax=Limnoraphis robusta TaxID=1118279 RepID=UPI002B200B07|nr:KGK domain-containing protein [Limnoraphis robusta]MEA5497998.1 KGK domain-containing protein [Limnoraphis robusta BA-68 BA1]MEA5539654.1 KGK domain-containing protein [Limnoraphis robusta Tam1]
MESIFNNGFQPLTCDEDVLLFEKDTFTVGRFKELVYKEVRSKIYYSSQKSFLILDQINKGYSIEHKISVQLQESLWTSCSEDIDCQLLGVGYLGWKKGKIRIKTDVNLCSQDYKGYTSNSPYHPQTIIKVDLEFCPDEPNEYQSPLDKLRQLESDLQKE